MFGGAVARGLDQFGQGVSKATQFYGQVAADDATNAYQSQADKLLNGDATKQVLQPDGTMGPDTGYYGKRGADAMSGRAGVLAQLDDLQKQTRAGLSSPESQLKFDADTRRLRAMQEERVGSHAETQFQTYAGAVNNSSADLALQHIAANADNEEEVKHGMADLVRARVQAAHIKYGNDPTIFADAERGARADALQARVQAIGATNPVRALQILDNDRELAGTSYETLRRSFQARAEAYGGRDLGASAWNSPGAGQPSAQPDTTQPGDVPLPPQRGDGGPPAPARFPPVVNNVPGDQSHALPPAQPNQPAAPYFAQAGAPYGISATYLARTHALEGNGTSSTGAKGPFQFIPSTWAKYGNGGSPFDFGASTMAAVRLAADNRASLTQSLGRAPTDAELYLAHQQGAGGAAKLLANPGVRAGDLVGDQAIRVNGGDPNAPAAAFTQKWVAKFNGAKPSGPLPMFAAGFGGTPYMGGPVPASGAGGAEPPPAPPAMPDTLAPAPGAPQPSLLSDATAAPAPPAPAQQPAELSLEERRASAVRAIQASGQSLEVQAHAVAEVNRLYQEQTFAQEADTKSKRDRNEKAMGTYTTQVLSGNVPPDILHRVAVDPNLQPETKWTLTRAIQSEMKDLADGKQDRTLGSGYTSAVHRISAQPDDPDRISDPATLMHMVNTGELTLEGFNKVRGLMTAGEKSLNDASANSSRASLLTYAKSKLSFQEDTGPIKIRDPVGEAIFNGRFVPKFEAAYDHWVKAGKDPTEFLQQENVDKMLKGMRSKSEMDASRIAAGLEPVADDPANPATPAGAQPAPVPAQAAPAPKPAAPAQVVPHAPPMTNPEQWPAIVQRPPLSSNGKPWPYANWARVLSTLKANPSDENRMHFDETFGPAGYHAADVLQRLEPLNPMGEAPLGAL